MENIPTITPEKIITTIKNKKTGEIYETEEALKSANIPEEQAHHLLNIEVMKALNHQNKIKR